MEFKERPRSLRKEFGLTQEDLGKKLNYGYTAISNYESGRNEPSIRDLKKIAACFQVSLDFLLCVSDIRNPYNPSTMPLEGEMLLENWSHLPQKQQETVSDLCQWLKLGNDNLASSKNLKVAQHRTQYNTKQSEKPEDPQ